MLRILWQSQMLYKLVTGAFAAAIYELTLPGSCLRKSHVLLSAVRILSDRMTERQDHLLILQPHCHSNLTRKRIMILCSASCSEGLTMRAGL